MILGEQNKSTTINSFCLENGYWIRSKNNQLHAVTVSAVTSYTSESESFSKAIRFSLIINNILRNKTTILRSLHREVIGIANIKSSYFPRSSWAKINTNIIVSIMARKISRSLFGGILIEFDCWNIFCVY